MGLDTASVGYLLRTLCSIFTPRQLTSLRSDINFPDFSTCARPLSSGLFRASTSTSRVVVGQRAAPRCQRRSRTTRPRATFRSLHHTRTDRLADLQTCRHRLQAWQEPGHTRLTASDAEVLHVSRPTRCWYEFTNGARSTGSNRRRRSEILLKDQEETQSFKWRRACRAITSQETQDGRPFRAPAGPQCCAACCAGSVLPNNSAVAPVSPGQPAGLVTLASKENCSCRVRAAQHSRPRARWC